MCGEGTKQRKRPQILSLAVLAKMQLQWWVMGRIQFQTSQSVVAPENTHQKAINFRISTQMAFCYPFAPTPNSQRTLLLANRSHPSDFASPDLAPRCFYVRNTQVEFSVPVRVSYFHSPGNGNPKANFACFDDVTRKFFLLLTSKSFLFVTAILPENANFTRIFLP